LRTMRLAVALLVSSLVLGSALPATAQTIVTDAPTINSIILHLQKALGFLTQSPPNLIRTQNQINRALALVPDPTPVAVGWFKIVVPYLWDQSSGPMPVQVGAMLDDGTPQPAFVGNVVLSMMAYGQIVALYDASMNPLPSFATTAFSNGGWQGYIMLKTSTGQTQDLGLHAIDPVSGVGGNSNPVTWTVP
jgi:hypothetical protein